MNIRGLGVGVLAPQHPHPPILNQRQVLSLAPGAVQRLDSSGRLISSLICQVETGVLDVWLADSGATDGFPDFRFQAGLGPQQVWLPANDYILTVSNPLQQTTGAVLRLLG